MAGEVEEAVVEAGRVYLVGDVFFSGGGGGGGKEGGDVYDG